MPSAPDAREPGDPGDPGPRERVLLLLRHAEAARPEGVRDRDRPVTDDGRVEAIRAGQALMESGRRPDLVLLSPSLRTRQTWELVAEVEPVRGGEVLEDARLYEASADEVMAVVVEHGGDAGTVLVCGHEPAMSALARDLTRGRGLPEAVSGVADGMPTGSVAVIDCDPPGPWHEVDGGRLTFLLPPAAGFRP